MCVISPCYTPITATYLPFSEKHQFMFPSNPTPYLGWFGDSLSNTAVIGIPFGGLNKLHNPYNKVNPLTCQSLFIARHRQHLQCQVKLGQELFCDGKAGQSLTTLTVHSTWLVVTSKLHVVLTKYYFRSVISNRQILTKESLCHSPEGWFTRWS